ncbi:MAG: flagellar basal body-associated FliL family protein [Cellvibrionaceae bacterium]
MAEENDQEDNNEEEKPKGNKKKLILFAVAVLVLIGISVGGTLVAVKLLTPEPEVVVELDEDGNPIDPSTEGEEEPEPPKLPAIYFPLKPPLIVNYEARGRQRFLQAEITVMAREDDVIEAIEIHMPMIRNSLILLFSGQVYEELQTDEGRELLRQAALVELQSIMEKEIGKPGVEKVLFTNLVMQ